MKRYEYKIYGKNGSYITTWKDVVSTPSFDWNINGGLGQLTVVLKRPFSSFGEGNDVWFENMLRLEVYDKESPDGRLLYTGRLNEYKPYFGDDERVEVSFVGYITELDDRFMRDETTVDAINAQYLVSSGVQTHYTLGQKFNPDPESPFKAYAWPFTSNHNNITGVGAQLTVRAKTEPTMAIGIMEAQYIGSTDQQGNPVSFYYPGKILASGVLQTATIPSGTDTPIQSFSTVRFPQKFYSTIGKKYFVFVAGSGVGFPVFSASDIGWSGDRSAFGWNTNDVALNNPAFTNTNATGFITDLGNISYFSNLSPRYDSEDPTDIMEDIIKNKYTGKITWDESNALTGYEVSYQFNKVKVLDGIQKTSQLADPNWYWYIDANNVLHWRLRDYNVVAHTLRLGFEIKSCSPTKSANEIKTRVLFYGGTPSGESELFREEDWWWQNDLYSLREQVISDGRVLLDETAKQFSRTYLDAHFRPQTYMTVDVLDSNADDNFGYDIDSFVPGQFVRIIDPRADNYQTQDGIFEQGFIMDETPLDISDTHILSEPLQILKISYKDKTATLSLGTILVDTPRRIEDIRRDQENINTKDSPLS